MPWRQNWSASDNFDYVTDLTWQWNEEMVWRDSVGSLTVSRVGQHSERRYRLRPGDWMFVDIVRDDQFLSRARVGTSKINCEHFVADQVVPRLLSHQGYLVLHAGAIEHLGGAILLVGASGLGKSTLSSSFVNSGSPLLGDDAIVISTPVSRPHAQAVYRSLRLLPDSMKALSPPMSSATPMADYSSKQRLDVPNGSESPLPVLATFILAPPHAGSLIELRQLSIANACMTYIENSFALDPSDTARARDRMEQASALARRVPAFAISYPRDYARLPEVRQAILDQVAALEPA